MSDIFREVDEEVRKDQLGEIWSRYGTTLLVTIGLILLAVAGWQFWQAQREATLQEAGGAFAKVEEALAADPSADAAALFADVAGRLEGGYATLAKLREAAALLSDGKRDDAVARYDAIAASAETEPRLAAYAGTMAAVIQADRVSPEELEARASKLAVGDNPFRATAKELLVVAALRRDDTETALALAAELAEAPETPNALRTRMGQVQRMLEAAQRQGLETEIAASPAEAQSDAIDLPVTIGAGGGEGSGQADETEEGSR